MMRSTFVRAMIATSLVVAAAPAANAQLGGLIKRKVTEAVKGPEKKTETPSAAAATGVTLRGDIIEVTPPVFEGFIRGLTAEVALTKEFRAELAKYPTAEAYHACESKVAMTEDGQKIVMQMSNLPENATAADMQRVTEKMNKEITALVKKSCPYNPADWPDHKRAERMQQIKAEAAAATGLEGTSAKPGPSDLEGDGGEPEAWTPFYDPFAAAGLTPDQYAILLERIQRFCDELKSAAGNNMGGSGGVKIPGSGTNVFWVYTAAEAKTLSQANCQRVYDLVGQMI